jgi:hypothetical protein
MEGWFQVNIVGPQQGVVHCMLQNRNTERGIGTRATTEILMLQNSNINSHVFFTIAFFIYVDILHPGNKQ